MSRPKLIFASKAVAKRAIKISEKNAFIQNVILIDTTADTLSNPLHVLNQSPKKITSKFIVSYTELVGTVKVRSLKYRILNEIN